MVHPVITTPLLLVSATLTGALLQYSWWTGTPALFALMAVAVWHSNHAMLSYQQLRVSIIMVIFLHVSFVFSTTYNFGA